MILQHTIIPIWYVLRALLEYSSAMHTAYAAAPQIPRDWNDVKGEREVTVSDLLHASMRGVGYCSVLE